MDMSKSKGERILRLPAFCEKIGLSRATVYRRYGHLRVKLGPNSKSATGWLDSDADKIINEAVAARDRAAAAE